MEPSPTSSEFADQSFAEKRPGLVVMLAGAATTIASLAIVYFLAVGLEFYAMGFYLNFVIPLGAIIVGLAAGSGYGLAAKFTGAKVYGSLIGLIAVLQLAAYFSAQYTEYAMLRAIEPAMAGVSFFAWFDAVTRAFAWNNNGQPGDPFGTWGYAMRAIEIVGFVLGGIIPPLMLKGAAYCDRCQVYMGTKEIAVVPASLPLRQKREAGTVKITLNHPDQDAALQQALAWLEQLQTAIAAGDAPRLRQLVHEGRARKKEAAKLPRRVLVQLQSCPRCRSGLLFAHAQTGDGENMKSTPLSAWPLTAELTEAAT